MKVFYLFSMMMVVAACHQNNAEIKIVKARIDSLEKRVANSYKPGFGEFMSGIQVHHAKLWFAGINDNWELAGFEVHEIMEALDDLQKFQPERKEIKLLPMLNPALDSLNAAIEHKNITAFKTVLLC